MKNVLELINLSSSAENFIGDQLSYFQEKGNFHLHLVCSDMGNLKDYAESQKVEYMALNLSRQLSPLQDIKAFFAICRYIRKHKIDIIFCHQAKARTLGVPAAWLMGVKHRIIFSHGVLHETMHGIKRLFVLSNDRLLSCMATKVICVSNHVKNARLKDKIDLSEKQIIIGHGSCNGIDTINTFNPQLVSVEALISLREKYKLNDGDFVVGFCGRLVKDKGIVELEEGFRLLQKKHSERKIKLLIIGSPEKRDAVPDGILESLTGNPDVIFTGNVPHNEIPEYYMLMDVFILPSHRDGLGLVPLEAQAMGIPALVTKITGCKETIVEDITGNYVDLTGESVCVEISKYFDENRRKLFGQQARKFVGENFEHTVFKERIFEFLNSLD